MASKYKRYGRGGSFKSSSAGDLGISTLKERDQTIIDSLQLGRNQQAEIDQSQMTGIERAFSKEQDNIKDLQQLEDKIYARQLENIKVRSQRDIEAIKGRADEYGRQAEHWEQLSPKLGKAFTALSTGYKNVTDKLGYSRAAQNQQNNDTLKLWADGFEEGEGIADETNLKAQEELKKAGVPETKLLALDSTSAIYRSGRVSYLMQDLVDNLDEHFDMGMKAFVEEFGFSPTNAEQYARAHEWIRNKIESEIGVSSYKYHKGVIKFREEFNKKSASRNNGHSRRRVAAVFSTKSSERNQIFESKLKQNSNDYYGKNNQTSFENLIEFNFNRGFDKEGNKLYNTKAEAIKAIYTAWAKDLSIDFDEIDKRLKFLTPADGRQGGDKATVGGRFPTLRAALVEERSSAMKKKNQQLETATKYVENKENINVRIKIANGDLDDLDARAEERKRLKALGPAGKKALDHMNKTFHQNNTNVGDIKDRFYSLVNNHKYGEAKKYIEHQGILNSEDRKELLAQIVPYQQIQSVTDYNEGVKGALQTALLEGLGYSKKDIEKKGKVARKLVQAESQFLAEYQFIRVGMKENIPEAEKTRRAVNLAITKVKEDIQLGKTTGKGTYGVIPKRGKKVDGVNIVNDTGSAVYAEDLIPLSAPNVIDYSLHDFTKADFDWTSLVDGTSKKRIVSNSQISNWTTTLEKKQPITSTSIVDDIAAKLPPDHALHGKPMLVIKTLMTNGPNATEASKAAAEKILIDNKDTAVIITDKEKYPNAVKKLKSACSNDEILKLLGYCKLIDQHNGQYPIKKLEINKKERSY
tara:strand:+ start:1618 stop:4044 length:2427 start_codon:yes stop_codon:yes gene_type:complete